MKQSNRKILGYVAVILAVLMLAGSVAAFAQTAAQPVKVSERATVVESPFTQAVRAVRDSVVGVVNYGMVTRNNSRSDFGFGFGFGGGRGGNQWPDSGDQQPREVMQGAGSGVVIAPGYVLTNYHVVENATRLEVTVGEDTYEATLIASDENLDIAVVAASKLELEAVVLGDSDVLNVGDWAICIGHPLSFNGTTTVGIISALDREITNSSRDVYGRRTNSVNKMIQTDAAINSGNSGGGMFNVAGELVGIPSMKISSSFYSGASVEGIGMAVPINVAKPLIEEALNGKTIDGSQSAEEGDAIVSGGKPRIGVTVANMNSSSYAVTSGILPRGAYVEIVEKGAPAETAGLKVGDIVVDVDGIVITGASQMVEILGAKQAGDTVAMKIYRVEGLETIENYQDIPEGEYIDLVVELAMLDNVKQ